MRYSSTVAAVLVVLTFTISIPGIASFQRRPAESSAMPVAPLTEAVWTGDRDRLGQLLAAGEDPAKEDEQGYTPWMWAILARDAQALSLLLARIPTIPVQEQRMLPMVAGQNDLPGVRLMLERSVPVDAPSTDGSGSSALLVAAASGYVDVMRELLTAGANANLQDKHGDTPLMAAVRIGSLDGIKLLLARGAETNQADEASRTALTWAARSRREDVIRLLRANGARGEAGVARHAPLSARAAAEKSLPLIQHSAAAWLEQAKCFSCHHSPMALRVAGVARERGFPLDQVKLRAQFENVRGSPGAPGAERGLASPLATLRGGLNNVASSSFAFSTALSSLVDFGAKRDDGDLNIVRVWRQALFLGRLQLRDGSWRYGGPRLPIESTDVTTTANAVRALDVYGSPEDASELSSRIARGRSWLLAKAADTTDEKVYRLLGLHWMRVNRVEINHQAEVLTREQNPDGGWAQLRGMNSDAYATGLVLVALHQTGELRATDAAYKHGVEYLLSNQEPDGSWLVTKRAVPSLPWLDTGFPHGKFQIISYVGTSWATMALMYAAPPSTPK